MKTNVAVAILVALGVAACSADSSMPTTPAAPRLAAVGHCQQVEGSVSGHFNPAVGWQATLVLRIGEAAAITGTFDDVNTSMDVEAFAAGLPFRGTETWFVTMPDGTFKVYASFVGVPVGPLEGRLNESGRIADGTGAYAGASGNITVHGPFMNPMLVPNAPWTSEVHGSICGL